MSVSAGSLNNKMKDFLRLVILATACAHAAHTYPKFSWHTVPVFAETSNVTGYFDDAALQSLSKFHMFVGGKAHAFDEPGFDEDKLTQLAGQLRALAPDIFLVYYTNANLDFTDYHLYNITA